MDISTWFKIVTGVRQGDIWSPLLFGLVIDFIMRHAVDDNNRGIVLIPRRSSRYPQVRLSDLDYADDIALFEESATKMAETTEAIRSLAGKLGLHMSFMKTELMTIGKSTASASTPSSTPIVPLGNEGNIKVVEHFKYLGTFCSADRTIGKELNNRLAELQDLSGSWR